MRCRQIGIKICQKLQFMKIFKTVKGFFIWSRNSKIIQDAFSVQPKNKYNYLINQKVAEEKDQMVSWPLLSDEFTEPDFIYSSK